MDVSRIVVGVDGSPSAEAALQWAVSEARRRGLSVHLLHTTTARVPVPSAGESSSDAVLDAARERVAAWAPELTVETTLDPRDPASALLDHSEGAALLVVGSHGKGLVARLLQGSVSHRVAGHAHCPAVVVHDSTGDASLPVAIGYDGSPGSVPALDLAAEEAALRGVALVVVHGWLPTPVSGFDALPVSQDVIDSMHDQARGVVAEAVARVHATRPDLEVQEVVVSAAPVAALAAVAEEAQLLVVGAHGTRAGLDRPFGSVSSAAIDISSCPVMVAAHAH